MFYSEVIFLLQKIYLILQFFQHVLRVEARVGEFTSIADVVVDVKDANDFRPQFSRSLHETQITEADDRDLPKTILKVRFHLNKY